MVLTRIEPMSMAKVYAVLGALYGLLIGLPFACFASMVGSQLSQFGDGGGAAGGIGILALIMYPIFGAIGGFIGGLISAFVYNLVAGWVGGIEMEFDGMGGGDIL
ncbi:MAG: hypothetical protein R3284_02470 [Rubricoccaceae bacterium]|nr:hypothetical protein [Rubricoccaceae bacterium]